MERAITTQGLGDKDVMLIKSYLGLLSGKTREPWTYVETGEADAEIVAGAVSAARGRVRIEFGPGAESPLRIRPPLRAASVIAALDAVSERLKQPQAVEAPPSAASEPLGTEVDDTTLAAVLRACTNEVRQVVSDGTTWIEIDPATARYRSSHPLTAAHARQSGWQPAGEAPTPYAAEGALTYLQWLAGMAEARVQPGRYRLRRWPDFGRLPHSPDFVRLAAFFARASGSPGAAAEAALVPMPAVEAFLGGCMLAGYAMRVGDEGPSAPPAAVPVAADPGFRGLLLRMRRRLGL